MSTNFYWEPAAKNPLSRFGIIHIGKRAGGWSFMFKGYRFKADGPLTVDAHPGLAFTIEVPELKFIVTTWGQWKAQLTEGGVIRDEYGTEHSLEDFIRMVEVDYAPSSTFNGKKVLNHVEHLRTLASYSNSDLRNENEYWVDPEGYSFGLREFS